MNEVSQPRYRTIHTLINRINLNNIASLVRFFVDEYSQVNEATVAMTCFFFSQHRWKHEFMEHGLPGLYLLF